MYEVYISFLLGVVCGAAVTFVYMLLSAMFDDS